MRLRPARTEDVGFLTDVVVTATRHQGRLPADFVEAEFRDGFADWTRELLADPGDGALFVIEIDDVPAGRLRLLHGTDHIEVAGLQLLPRFQNRGVGTAILTDLKDRARAAGNELRLGVEKDNFRARRLYRRLGFRHHGRTESEYLLRWSPVVDPVLNAEFEHPRLAAVYDAECPWGPDDDHFAAAVAELSDPAVLDLGCGTGRLTVALARAGHRVTGVDPAVAALAAARAKPGADRVTWLTGDSTVLPADAFDIALMTSHVAQFFVDDGEWEAVLGDLRRALRPGGRLVFDSRDPAAEGWRRWDTGDSPRPLRLPDGSTVRGRTEVTEVSGPLVTAVHHSTFDDGERLTARVTLRFRPETELRESLRANGFDVAAVYGGWHREPVGHPTGELVVHAVRR